MKKNIRFTKVYIGFFYREQVTIYLFCSVIHISSLKIRSHNIMPVIQKLLYNTLSQIAVRTGY